MLSPDAAGAGDFPVATEVGLHSRRSSAHDSPAGHTAGTVDDEPLSGPPSPLGDFLDSFFGQILLQHYSLSIAHNCFLEFLSRRKCVFLRNRCSSPKPKFHVRAQK